MSTRPGFMQVFGLLVVGSFFWSVSLAPAQALYTIAQRLQQYGPTVETRLKPFFDKAHVAYPPTRLTYVVLKAEGVLQIYAADDSSAHVLSQAQDPTLTHIVSFRIEAESGTIGPKLRWLDNQVPEGIYEADRLNPNSDFHLALHVDYPNKEDRLHAQEEHRTHLGGEIMIHGSQYSIGCVAMGDEVAEDLFVLAALIQPRRVRLIFAPYDLRKGSAVVPADSPETSQIPWLHGLYERIEKALETCPETQ